MGRFKIKGLRWYIAGLLCLVTTINYIDRTTLQVVGPVLRDELHIDANDFANIIIFFQLSYLIMQPIVGRVMDWLGTKTGFSLAVIWWSVANMLHAFARTPLSFGAARALLGVGEAGNFPGVAKTASEWFPPKERTMATGIANVGSGTGSMIAVPLVAWIVLKWGWHEAFIVTGALGFFWLILWHFLYHLPEKHPNITQEELDYIRAGQEETDVDAHPEVEELNAADSGNTRTLVAAAIAMAFLGISLYAGALAFTSGADLLINPGRWMQAPVLPYLLGMHLLAVIAQLSLSGKTLRYAAWGLLTPSVVGLIYWTYSFIGGRVNWPYAYFAFASAGIHCLILMVQSASGQNAWRFVLGKRNFWGIAMPRFLAEPAWQFFSYWIIMYMMDTKGIDLKQVAYFAWVPFLAADVGSFLGGMLSPYYQRLGLPLIAARKTAMLTGALMMPFLLLVLSARTPGWAIFWFCFGPFGHNIISSVMLTLPADLFPKRTVATANGLSGCVGYIGGMAFTKVVGVVVTATHNYVPIFIAMAFLDIIGAVILFSLVRQPRAASAVSA